MEKRKVEICCGASLKQLGCMSILTIWTKQNGFYALMMVCYTGAVFKCIKCVKDERWSGLLCKRSIENLVFFINPRESMPLIIFKITDRYLHHNGKPLAVPENV